MEGYLLLWIIVILGFAVVETMTVTFFSICFSIAGIGALITNLLGLSLVYQLIVYIIILLICLIFIMPIMKKILKIKINDKRGPITRTNLDVIIGQEAICLEQITKYQEGLVKVAGKEWTAKTKEDILINKDDIVIIEDIVGSKVIIKKK